ncbi:HAD family hydrolase [Streptomyces sp. NPDC002156]
MAFLQGVEETAYRELTAPDAWLPYPDTEPVLRALRARGLRIGIVSDFAWDLRIHLARQGLDDLFDACVISCEVGREKPDPHLFLKACADLGANPRATLMVGDNPVRDGGATACGLPTYILPAEHRTGDRGLTEILRLVT